MESHVLGGNLFTERLHFGGLSKKPTDVSAVGECLPVPRRQDSFLWGYFFSLGSFISFPEELMPSYQGFLRRMLSTVV